MRDVSKVMGLSLGFMVSGLFLAGAVIAQDAPKKAPVLAVAACSQCEAVTADLNAKKEVLKTMKAERNTKEKADLQALKTSDPAEFKKAMKAKRAERENKKAGVAKPKLSKEMRLAQEEALKSSDPELYQAEMDVKALVSQKKECEKACPAK